MSKICFLCLKSKDSSEFTRYAKSKDGLHRHCRVCKRSTENIRYSKNSEDYSSRNKIWRDNNKFKKATTDRTWKQANKERVHQMERNRLHVRRAKIRGAVGIDSRLSKAEQVIFGYYGTICMYPNCSIDNPSLDHIVPFALGGKHGFDNLQVLCKTHNTSKQHRESIDYRPVSLIDSEINEILEVV